MRTIPAICLLSPLFVAACASNPDKHTLSELQGVEADVEDVTVENGLDRAILGYRAFLEETPESELTPEAMRRLADLKIEKEYGIIGDGKLVELPTPESGQIRAARSTGDDGQQSAPDVKGEDVESDQEFELRAGGELEPLAGADEADVQLPAGEEKPEWAGPLEAIELYDRILAAYPDYEHNDGVLYQKARAYDELGRPDDAMSVMDELVSRHPYSKYFDEVQFRRAEYFFTRKKYLDAETAYSAIVTMGEGSEYYELALYKLGWTLYKQQFHEEAVHQYVALLDYKLSQGYDFDQEQEEAEERRVADTYRVISLSFSNLGGPDVVDEYFAANGHRSYEDRIYSHLGDFYFEKLRYDDAAKAYKAFIRLYPLHKSSPHFSMRVVEIFDAGGFPKLVLESKRDFAANYGLQSEYWQHHDTAEDPEVLDYLKNNLEDLAHHYHALYQVEELAEEKPTNYQEALRWYHEYLESFPQDAETPGINYQLADLLLENEDFGEAALEYERTAYGYGTHEQAAAAGYAAIYSHREHENVATGAERSVVRRDAVNSTLRFVDVFPEHENADVVLGAAVDDLYDMKEFESAIANGHRLVDQYPQADPVIHRAAWAVIAHSSMDIARYPEAEYAYSRVLEMTPVDDESRQAIVDNLAAAIYKQGEQANQLEDFRAAADHFLRITQVAPTSEIRPAAEYDAGAALMRLEDWSGAAAVLDDFRKTFPENELNRDATRQIAYIYREDGQSARAAEEYERVAEEAEDPELGRESLLLAGDLYDESGVKDRALDVYLRYVDQYPEPVETAVETRHKVAGMYEAASDLDGYREQLQAIVDIDAAAGEARTPRTRYLAARAGLVLAQDLYARFDEVRLVQPFEQSLQDKQARMDEALAALEALVDYEDGEVTAAATFYIAEVYYEFSQSLIDSERPADLSADELQDYEMMIEEEAFPFEERAIEVHEKNLELLANGVFNPWIEKSLDELADLMPGRYAKFEISTGFLDSIDTYAYRSPGASALTEGGQAGEQNAAPKDSATQDGSEDSSQTKQEAPAPAAATG